MIRCLHYAPGQGVRTNLDITSLAPILEDQNSLLWVDFEGTSPEHDEPVLTQVFGFHPLAVDDALQESHVPKIDDWDDYLYIVLHALSYNQVQGTIETRELDIFAGALSLLSSGPSYKCGGSLARSARC